MKLKDEVARMVAARHCKTNIVTTSEDTINFHDKIRKGCVITVSGRMTFTSNESMEIEVLVDADPVVDKSQQRYRAASAFFTYVSPSQEGKSLPVPQLVPETEDEKKHFEEGEGRYLQTKAKWQGQAEPQPWTPASCGPQAANEGTQSIESLRSRPLGQKPNLH